MKYQQINMRTTTANKNKLLRQAQQERKTLTDLLLADMDNTPLKEAMEGLQKIITLLDLQLDVKLSKINLKAAVTPEAIKIAVQEIVIAIEKQKDLKLTSQERILKSIRNNG